MASTAADTNMTAQFAFPTAKAMGHPANPQSPIVNLQLRWFAAAEIGRRGCGFPPLFLESFQDPQGGWIAGFDV